jgi:hypothetical protein
LFRFCSFSFYFDFDFDFDFDLFCFVFIFEYRWLPYSGVLAEANDTVLTINGNPDFPEWQNNPVFTYNKTNKIEESFYINDITRFTLTG